MNKKFDKYQGLIFDMDGTLLDTMPTHLDAWEITAKHYGFPFSRQWLNGLGGMPSIKIVGEINRLHDLDLDAKEVSEFKMRAFSNLDLNPAPIACAKAVFDDYLGKKPIAIGTGSQRESATKLLAQSDILDKLDALVTASDVEHHKPNPDTFLAAAKGLGVDPRHCVVFEDTELGKQAAHAAGMDCYMVVGNQLVFSPLKEKQPQ